LQIISIYTFYVRKKKDCILFLNNESLSLLLSEEGRKCYVAVHPVPCDAHSFSHGESGGYRTNAKSFDMSKTDSGKKGSDSQTDDVKADLDLRVGDGSDLGQLSWKKVCRHDWHLAAVGKCDPDAQEQVADDKIKYPVANGYRQDAYPHFMYIEHLAECKSNDKTEKVRCDEFLTHDHQG